MKVEFKPTVIGALGTVTEGLIKGLEGLEIRGRVETIQTTVWLRSARIQKRVQATWRDFLLLKLQRKTDTNMKNFQGVNKYGNGDTTFNWCDWNIPKVW